MDSVAALLLKRKAEQHRLAIRRQALAPTFQHIQDARFPPLDPASTKALLQDILHPDPDLRARALTRFLQACQGSAKDVALLAQAGAMLVLPLAYSN
jgi:hypothetical protein